MRCNQCVGTWGGKCSSCYADEVEQRAKDALLAVGGLSLILAAQAIRDRLDSDMMDAFDAANEEADRKQKEGFERAMQRDREAMRYDRG